MVDGDVGRIIPLRQLTVCRSVLRSLRTREDLVHAYLPRVFPCCMGGLTNNPPYTYDGADCPLSEQDAVQVDVHALWLLPPCCSPLLSVQMTAGLTSVQLVTNH
jgi:hypothetical protein